MFLIFSPCLHFDFQCSLPFNILTSLEPFTQLPCLPVVPQQKNFVTLWVLFLGLDFTLYLYLHVYMCACTCTVYLSLFLFSQDAVSHLYLFTSFLSYTSLPCFPCVLVCLRLKRYPASCIFIGIPIYLNSRVRRRRHRDGDTDEK